MTGYYIRVRRGNEYLNIEVEHLTDKERERLLKDDPRLINWLHAVCKCIVSAENTLELANKLIKPVGG